MATIAGTIRLNDSFSNTLNKFNSGIQRSVAMTSRFKSALSSGSNGFNSLNRGLSSTHLGLKQIIAGSAIGGAISSAMGVAGNSVRAFAGELNESTKAWATFEGNMHQIGKSPASIASAKKSLQQFAQDTIYSSSDMAQTYSQLAAVGTKNTTKLVKGFGGLAAAATDPSQAMKTLSEQATQMAAKPMVQWQDFKLMLEQTPAGMAAVGKTMGMSTKQLVKAVQDGKIKTESFLNAIAKTGTNANFSKMATQYKTIGQAMDGLKETVANKVQPQFKKLSDIGINAISGFTDALGNVNFGPFSDGLINAINYIQPILDKLKLGFQDIVDGFNSTGAGDAIGQMFQKIADSVNDLTDTFSGNSFYTVIGSTIGQMAGGLAKLIGTLASVTGKLDPGTLKALGLALLVLKTGAKGLVLTAVVVGLKALNKLNPSQLQTLAKAITALAIAFAVFKVVGAIGKGIFGIVSAFKTLKGLKAPQLSAPEVPPAGGIAQSAGAFIKLAAALVLVGIAIVITAGGFLLLAQAANTLASGGGTVIAIFFGMIVAIAALAVVVRFLGSEFIAGAVGFLVFGAALLVISAAIAIAAAGLTLLATQLPNIANYGAQAAGNLVLLAGAIVVFGIAAIVATIGIMVFAVGLALATPLIMIAAVGMLMLGAASIVLGAGLLLVGTALMVVAAGIAAVGVAVLVLVSMFIMAGSMMVSAITSAMSNVVSAVRNGVASAVNAARSFAGALVSVGRDLIQGLVNGITSMIGSAVSAVTSVASKVVSAAKGILHIGSPSKLFNQFGRWVDQGLAIGLGHDAGIAVGAASDMAAGVVDAASDMTPTVNPLSIAETNTGDLLTNGFNRAFNAINQVANALSSLDGTSAGIGINRHEQFATSLTSDTTSDTTADYKGLVGAQFGSNSTNDNRSSTITIESGAIQINSSGSAEYDADKLLSIIENGLMAKQEKALN